MAAEHTAPDYRDVTRRAGPDDTRTLLGFTVLVVGCVWAARVGQRTAAGFADDLRTAFAGFPEGLARVVLGLVLATYLVLVLATPVWLVARRRLGLLGRVLLGVLVGLIGYGLLIRTPSVAAWTEAIEAAAKNLSVPQAWDIAAFAAVTVVVGPAITHRWRRALWTLLVLLALVRVISTSAGPVGVALAVGAGGMAGAALLLALGRSVPQLTTAGLARLMAAAGEPVHDVSPLPRRSDGWDFTAATPDGPVLVRVVDERDWRVDLIRRRYRRLRWRGLGDEMPYGSPVRAVSNEALVGLLAAQRGVRVARVLAVSAGTNGDAVLAVTDLGGTRLADLPDDRLTDAVLAAAWAQAVRLASARIAVRELNLAHLVLTGPDQVGVVDLARAQPASDDGLIARDAAELLAATSVRVGAARAVAAATAALGTDRLALALTRLVPDALSATTRAALKDTPDGLHALVEKVSAAAGVDEPQFAKVTRMSPRTLLMAAALAVAIYVLAPQLTDVDALANAVVRADWRWLPAVAVASAMTYLGAALGLAGGTPGRVPVGQTFAVATASAFVATFSPPGVGQVGLNVRFLQKKGYPTGVAASASAVKEAAVLVVHLSILAAFALWAGSTDALSGELKALPSLAVVLAVVGGVLGLLGIALAVPQVRGLMATRVRPALISTAAAMKEVVSSPAKLGALFGGVALLPLGNALALYFSVRALGVHASFVAVVLVSLTAGAIAQAAPTPGGIGAVEAVLLASLQGVGVPAESALAAVFVFRLATFWLPILPGAVAFRVLTRRDVL